MAAKKTNKGSLTINSENIFPIIKKWLYSDHDIFIRELISNGVDAVTKMKRLASLGEAELEEGEQFRVTVYASPKDKTLTFEDNGIGMTAEEVDKYINQIAFSGATDFLEKYKDKDQNDQIIGHFGLGFYSAFMVAEKVEIETMSYQEGAKGVHWECDGGTEFTMSEVSGLSRGTRITLYMAEDSLEFCNEFKCREVIGKYCSFMPVEIYFVNEDKAKEKAEAPEQKKAEEKKKAAAKKKAKKDEDDLIGDTPAEETEDTTHDDIVETDDADEPEEKEEPINDTHPLWMKTPGDCTDEEYKDFYQKVFYDFKEPMFWIHLNMDYPFNLKGILYFPRINPNMDQLEGKVKLYNNQVFVADNIKEVIPEFLLVLKGVIDCPDLPLNVSRSALQNDGFVRKISDHITKKVADKLIGMCKNHRDEYEKLWDDLSPFVKFGCLRDDKFNEKMKDYIIYKNLEGKYVSLAEYLEAAKETHENQVFYVTDEQLQAKYIELFKAEGVEPFEFKVGTMIEVPRAALTADAVAVRAEYFSFGTNDLTQMTFGYSRDDIASFLPVYLEKKILKVDPFQVLDQKGVGQLIKMAVEKGRSVRPDLKCGICGEHGGEPSSVKFCHRVGLNYVSCSPFRVPIARLAAAQAAVEE